MDLIFLSKMKPITDLLRFKIATQLELHISIVHWRFGII